MTEITRKDIVKFLIIKEEDKKFFIGLDEKNKFHNLNKKEAGNVDTDTKRFELYLEENKIKTRLPEKYSIEELNKEEVYRALEEYNILKEEKINPNNYKEEYFIGC